MTWLRSCLCLFGVVSVCLAGSFCPTKESSESSNYDVMGRFKKIVKDTKNTYVYTILLLTLTLTGTYRVPRNLVKTGKGFFFRNLRKN